MASAIMIKDHNGNLSNLKFAKSKIEKLAFLYADGNIQHRQVSAILKEMKEINEMTGRFIDTMKLS